jgi:para-aminobenzoate synthetase
MHGRRSRIYHSEHELFTGIPQGFLAVRYHSLAAHEPLPAELEVTARTSSGTVMAVRHRVRPHWGVQFHPESVETEWGEKLMRNFCALAEKRAGSRRRPPPAIRAQTARVRRPNAGKRKLEVVLKTVRNPPDSESTFVQLYADEPSAFWLDSSSHRLGMGRFSYMGAAGGPLSLLATHDVAAGELTTRSPAGEIEHHRTALLDWLEQHNAGFAAEGRDFFTGGFVGYLGYELKAECGSPNRHRSAVPDAALLFADRLIAFDHDNDQAHVVALADAGGRADAIEWAERTASRLRGLGSV